MLKELVSLIGKKNTSKLLKLLHGRRYFIIIIDRFGMVDNWDFISIEIDYKRYDFFPKVKKCRNARVVYDIITKIYNLEKMNVYSHLGHILLSHEPINSKYLLKQLKDL